MARICESLPSTMSRCLLRNHEGILYCVGFWMMVTIRSSSSEVSSPALHICLASCSYQSSSIASVPLVQVDVGLLADQVGVSATDTLDLGQGVHDLLFSVNIGVEKTENLLPWSADIPIERRGSQAAG